MWRGAGAQENRGWERVGSGRTGDGKWDLWGGGRGVKVGVEIKKAIVCCSSLVLISQKHLSSKVLKTDILWSHVSVLSLKTNLQKTLQVSDSLD